MKNKKIREVLVMATSTFNKQFYISRKKADEFIKEMAKEIKPTLTNEFKTQLKQERDVRNLLQKAL